MRKCELARRFFLRAKNSLRLHVRGDWRARQRQYRRAEIEQAYQFIVRRSRLDLSRPANDQRYAQTGVVYKSCWRI